MAELRALHWHIFQDIFEWAGQLRMIDMRRGNGKFFAPAAGLTVNLSYFFESLRADDYLSGLERREFLHGLARFYDDLNFIHPFREGNGRVQRLFWSRVSLDAGWLLDWRPIHGAELDEVSRAAREDGDLAGLVGALDRCLSKPTRSGAAQ